MFFNFFVNISHSYKSIFIKLVKSKNTKTLIVGLKINKLLMHYFIKNFHFVTKLRLELQKCKDIVLKLY